MNEDMRWVAAMVISRTIIMFAYLGFVKNTLHLPILEKRDERWLKQYSFALKVFAFGTIWAYAWSIIRVV